MSLGLSGKGRGVLVGHINHELGASLLAVLQNPESK